MQLNSEKNQNFSQSMQRIKAVIPTFLCTPPCVWAPPAFEVTQRCCQKPCLHLFQGAEILPIPFLPIQHFTRCFFTAQHGRSSKGSKFFSTLPELGQAEIVPWKPYKASKANSGFGLTLPPGWMLGKEGSSPRSQGETSRPFEVLPCASATCQRDALIRWQQLINSLDFFFFCGAPTPGPKRRRKFVIQSETAVKKKK